nr:DUF1289 domain-containing protein [Salinimonas lutimaris]
MPDHQPHSLSPCIGYCKLSDEEICAGCHRHIDEIIKWQQFSNRQKHMIIHQCALREKASS